MVGAEVESLVSQAAASRATGLPVRSIQYLLAAGKLRSWRIADGVRRVRLSDVRAVIRECGHINESAGQAP